MKIADSLVDYNVAVVNSKAKDVCFNLVNLFDKIHRLYFSKKFKVFFLQQQQVLAGLYAIVHIEAIERSCPLGTNNVNIKGPESF